VRVGFLNNQIDNRGTGNALYDYAHYNETILGNESVIFTLTHQNADQGMQDRLVDRFGDIWSVWALVERELNIDFIYHIKYGNMDGFHMGETPYGVHAVFDGSQPHGDRYATISEYMGRKYKIPYVPHIVSLAEPTQDFRAKYDIPQDAYIYGRHGGADTFDIPWAWDAINEAMYYDDSLYFMFMNTEIPNVKFFDPSRLTFIANSANPAFKSSFIHSTDAMLHARSRGETFGIAVGEFAIAGKPVITYGGSGERAHLDYLGRNAIKYWTKTDLYIELLRKPKPYMNDLTDYANFTPENVMKKFKEVFLDEANSP